MGMHISQRDPREAFMEMVCTMVTGPSRDNDYIIIFWGDALAFASLWTLE